MQKDFIKVYSAFTRSGSIINPTPKLYGKHDLVNAANGFEESKPVLIGDEKKALAWSGAKKIDKLLEMAEMKGIS